MENPQAVRRYAIGPPALFGRKWLDPPQLLQSGNRPIQRSRTQTTPAQACDVFDHRVSMFRSTGKAGQHQQGRVGIMSRSRTILGVYYVSRTTHDVVLARRHSGLQDELPSHLNKSFSTREAMARSRPNILFIHGHPLLKPDATCAS